MNLPTITDTDDRRTCQQCTQLAKFGGLCQAAKSGDIVAGQNYAPDRELLRRCEGYRPDASDPDRRSGLQRWPGLRHINKPDNNRK